MDDKLRLMSPCIGVCIIDNEKLYCKGCFRTMEEISKWINYTDEERINILAKTREREEASII